MDKRIKVQIIAQDKLIAEKEADMVVVPAASGEIGFMFDHTAFLSSLNQGLIRLYRDQKVIFKKSLHHDEGGFCQFNDNKCQILLNKKAHSHSK